MLGSGNVDAGGRYEITLRSAQTDGERVEAVQSDAAGNASGTASTIAPDFTAPAQPVAAINGDGTLVTGTGEPGAQIVVRDLAGTTIGIATIVVNTKSGDMPMPKGGVDTGAGGTSGTEDTGLIAVGAVLLLGAGTAVLVARRRRADQS